MSTKDHHNPAPPFGETALAEWAEFFTFDTQDRIGAVRYVARFHDSAQCISSLSSPAGLAMRLAIDYGTPEALRARLAEQGESENPTPAPQDAAREFWESEFRRRHQWLMDLQLSYPAEYDERTIGSTASEQAAIGADAALAEWVKRDAKGWR